MPMPSFQWPPMKVPPLTTFIAYEFTFMWSKDGKLVTILLCVEIICLCHFWQHIFSKGKIFFNIHGLGMEELVRSWWKWATMVLMCCKPINPMWPYNSMRRQLHHLKFEFIVLLIKPTLSSFKSRSYALIEKKFS
jgi:hypothetical protein